MTTRLVIVESPAKAKKIGEYLGAGYRVESSIGHIRDLPASAKDVPASVKGKPWASMGVNVDKGFEPVYVINADKRKTVKELKTLLKDADELYLATDKDREGEAIAWHLLQVLKPSVPVKRMVFGEITKSAIQEAISNTTELDIQLVNAQEARRILDRLYGYEVSPVLWKKVAPGLSAGRVQSVATRIIVDRERERMAFTSANYWDIAASLQGDGVLMERFPAKLVSVGGTKVATGKDFSQAGELTSKDVLALGEPMATALAAGLHPGSLQVTSVDEKPFRRKPYAPFSTSTLQQEASRKLRLSARRTMQIAQWLYEHGYITYMRTDSYQLSDEAIKATRAHIKQAFGANYVPDAPRVYGKKAKNAQEAHEAIRPAGDTIRTPEQVRNEISVEQFKMYELIYKRTVASQMSDAVGQSVTVQFTGEASDQAGEHAGTSVGFTSSGRTITFPGFLRVYTFGAASQEDDDAEGSTHDILLPAMFVGQSIEVLEATPVGHDTKPPARYTEASLVQKLEELGVGRPSTYASVISTIIARNYVWKKGATLVPSFTAFSVVKLLEQHFPHLVDYAFTAQMEEDLDHIAMGELERTPWLTEFYFGDDTGPGLKPMIEANLEHIDAASINALPIGTDSEGRTIVVKSGRYGPYLQRSDESKASLPDDVLPDELTVQAAGTILETPTDMVMGTDPATGKPVIARNGRYGPYIQVGAPEDGKPEKTASLLPGMSLETLTFADCERLLLLPRDVGPHPEDGEPIVIDNGRYGPYLRWGKETRTLPDLDCLFSYTQADALALLAQPKTRGKRVTVLRELGNDFLSGNPMVIRTGAFGDYVTDGEINASLQKRDTVENMTDERASELLQARRERMELQGKTPGTKASAKKAAAKKPAANKATTKATAKKPAAKKAPATKPAAKKTAE